MKKLKIAIIGFGSQGRAQALNLRDGGFQVTIGLTSKSGSRKKAQKEGLKVTTPRLAVAGADIIAILIPDHKHHELFNNDIAEAIHPEQTFVFAHSMSVHFGLIEQPGDVDFVLVAPHGPGKRLREKFVDNDSILSFVAKTDKSSKQSLKTAAKYAKAIGCGGQDIIVTSFAEEAVGDIFGEQAVLCGGLSGLLKAGFNTLVDAGLPPENAYLECVYQLDLIVDLIKQYGIDGMYDRISTTATYGSVQAEDIIINDKSKAGMKRILKDITGGKFGSDLINDYKKTFSKLKKLRRANSDRLFEETARKFAKRYGG